MAGKKVYLNLKDLAEYHKVDKELMTDYMIDKGFLKRIGTSGRVIPTEKGLGAGIHEVSGKFGKFLLFDRSMNLFDLIKYRKYGSDNKKKKGDRYEQFVARKYEEKGYLVKYNGCEEGMEDNSVDLIAVNKNEALLIQCKNWSLDWVEKNNKFITQKDLKSFYGDAVNYIEKHPYIKQWNVRFIFVCSDKILSKDAYAMIKNDSKIEFKIIKMQPFKNFKKKD